MEKVNNNMTTNKRKVPIEKFAQQKRQYQIKRYFAKQRSTWAILVVLAGIIIILVDLYIFGKIVFAAGIVFLIFDLIQQIRKPSDEIIDTWLLGDLQILKERAFDHLNINMSDLIQEPIIIVGPVLWLVNSLSKDDVKWKKGKDSIVRFNINNVLIICLTDRALGAYQCDYNFMANSPCNERTDELYHKDIVAITTRDSSMNYTMPNGQRISVARSFSIVVTSGERISVIIDSPDIARFTGGNLSTTNVDHAVRVIRKVLREKKAL